ncbi:PadR family transcriptional regulator [Rubrobacter indicoceani]|uniref:PadR family transcriptional regulator n=1 Tax=Rubrobacter indicoceani TaxID=2051957 RepID=UPI000E5A585B|nr:PadR family transcriptional regulator [Rubrobacter indicoceani]
MKTLEYTILAGLSHRRRSGYDLTRWLELVASHFWPAKHSSIYPALASLERAGLVAHEVVPSEQGPVRKVYSLTGAGQEALLSWVEGSAEDPQIRDEQLVKTLCYGFLSRDQALRLLREARGRRASKLAHFEELQRRLDSGLDPEGRADPITGHAYLGTLLVLRKGIRTQKSYIEWCDEAADIISAWDDEGCPTGRMPAERH